MIHLALATAIPVREWREEDERTIATAIDLLDEMDKAKKPGGGKSAISG